MKAISCFLFIMVIGCSRELPNQSFRIDYSHEVREMSEAFNSVPWDVENYDISQWKRMDLEQRVEFEILSFEERFDAEDAIVAIGRRGYRPANMDELLAFGRAHEEEYRGHPVFALGTLWKSPDFDMYVAYLYSSSAGRIVGILGWRQEFPSDARFLAIREDRE